MNKKLERLIKRLYDKMVVPFLGAGISYTAGPDGLTQSQQMTMRLAKEILNDPNISQDWLNFLSCVSGGQNEVPMSLCPEQLGAAGFSYSIRNLYSFIRSSENLRNFENQRVCGCSPHPCSLLYCLHRARRLY